MPPRNPIPEELRNVAHIEDLSAIDEKVNKCYSEERYKKFQTDVEDIVLKTLGHESGIEKIKKYGRDAAKEFIQQDNWEKLKFWIPTVVSIIAVGVTIYIAFFKPR